MEEMNANAAVSRPETKNAPVISVGEWVLAMLIMAIPIVNIVMLFIWGFGKDTNPTKANWAKAGLIWIAIGIILYVIFFSTFMAMFAMMGRGM